MAAIAVALPAALLFAVSAALMQFAARSAALRRETGDRGAGLLRSRWWLAGFAVNLAGFALHALALRLGSIVVVQAVLVCQLLFAVPLARLRGRVPLARDWFATATVCGGLAVLLGARGVVPQTTDRRHDLPAVVAVVVCVVVLLLAARRPARQPARRPPRHRPQLDTVFTAVAAGLCVCLTATFLVFVTADLAAHGPAGLVSWPAAGLLASTGGSFVLGQAAFAAGSLPTALTTMAITDPAASWVVGVLLFNAGSGLDAVTVAGCVTGGLLVIVGVATLASSPTVRDGPSDYRLDGGTAAGVPVVSSAYPASSPETVADHV